MKNAHLELKDHSLFLSGKLDFYNVVSICQEGLQFIKLLNNVRVDFKDLTRSDSSGLSLLVAWTRAARKENKEIIFINLPIFLKNISKVCGLKGVLPISWEN
jgi:phospholipid transport system transporter-binding protein